VAGNGRASAATTWPTSIECSHRHDGGKCSAMSARDSARLPAAIAGVGGTSSVPDFPNDALTTSGTFVWGPVPNGPRRSGRLRGGKTSRPDHGPRYQPSFAVIGPSLEPMARPDVCVLAARRSLTPLRYD